MGNSSDKHLHQAITHPSKNNAKLLFKDLVKEGTMDRNAWTVFIKELLRVDWRLLCGCVVMASVNGDECEVLSQRSYEFVSKNTPDGLSVTEFAAFLVDLKENGQSALGLNESYALKEWPVVSNETALTFLEWRGFRSYLREGVPSKPFKEKGDFKVWEAKHVLGPSLTTTFVSQGIVPTDAVTLLGLIKESDIGSLAGNLADWKAEELSEHSTSIDYTSKLPPPFNPRRFSVYQVCAVDANEVLFLGFDSPSKQVDGHCLFSFYRIQTIDEGCLLRRAINIDLATIFSETLLLNALADNYLNDFTALVEASKDIPKALTERLEEKDVYKMLRKTLKA